MSYRLLHVFETKTLKDASRAARVLGRRACQSEQVPTGAEGGLRLV
jgi:hypothetical protein